MNQIKYKTPVGFIKSDQKQKLFAWKENLIIENKCYFIKKEKKTKFEFSFLKL